MEERRIMFMASQSNECGFAQTGFSLKQNTVYHIPDKYQPYVQYDFSDMDWEAFKSMKEFLNTTSASVVVESYTLTPIVLFNMIFSSAEQEGFMIKDGIWFSKGDSTLSVQILDGTSNCYIDGNMVAMNPAPSMAADLFLPVQMYVEGPMSNRWLPFGSVSMKIGFNET